MDSARSVAFRTACAVRNDVSRLDLTLPSNGAPRRPLPRTARRPGERVPIYDFRLEVSAGMEEEAGDERQQAKRAEPCAKTAEDDYSQETRADDVGVFGPLWVIVDEHVGANRFPEEIRAAVCALDADGLAVSAHEFDNGFVDLIVVRVDGDIVRHHSPVHTHAGPFRPAVP